MLKILRRITPITRNISLKNHAYCASLPRPIISSIQYPNKAHLCFTCSIHTTSYNFGKIVKFALADIGEGIREVTITEWFVKVGDQVNQFDVICEVQSDKAAVTITSRFDGIVKKLHYETDEVAFVGQPLVDIELLDNGTESQGSSAQETEASSSSDSDDASPKSLRRDASVLATPSVRRLAKEHKITLSKIYGTGKAGRILKEDILAYLSQGAQQDSIDSKLSPAEPAPHPTSAPLIQSSPTVEMGSQDKSVKLNSIQKAMWRSMEVSLRIPHLTLMDEVCMDTLMELRNHCNVLLSKKHVTNSRVQKVTFMPFFIKAASMAISQFPIMNAQIPEGVDSDTILFKASHNIGFAMDTPSGLVVPNIKNVEKLNVLEIAEQLQHLITLGANNKLSLNDVNHGTFTISNIGSIGGTYTKPVIMPPQVAIGGIGRIQPVVKPNPSLSASNPYVTSHMTYISWSADHRVIDGATVARFSSLWKRYIEHPQLMSLELK